VSRLIVNIGNSQKKWHDLLLLLRNSTSTSFCLEFPDSTTAKNAVMRMLHQIEKYSSWFPMVVARRGSNVYIVKTAFARKVVVKDEPDKDDE
jgi:hypothetical protein